MLKRTPFYREILVGDDSINGSSGTPEEAGRFKMPFDACINVSDVKS